jgi:hypothetical protein
MPARNVLYRRLADLLAERLGTRVDVDWDYTAGRDRKRSGSTTKWLVTWSDGPRVATMRGLVADCATRVGLDQPDVDALRYYRMAQDPAVLALAIAHRRTHPRQPVKEWEVRDVHEGIEHPERLDEPTRAHVTALLTAYDHNLYRAIDAINAQPADGLTAWLDLLAGLGDTSNVISISQHTRRKEGGT